MKNFTIVRSLHVNRFCRGQVSQNAGAATVKISMQDADIVQHDQAAADEMITAKTAGSSCTKQKASLKQAAVASHNTLNSRSPVNSMQAEQHAVKTVQNSCMQEAEPFKPAAARKPAAAPASKRQKTAAKKAPARKAKAAAASEDADSDDAVDGDEPDTAAAAAADAATFSAQEVTEVSQQAFRCAWQYAWPRPSLASLAASCGCVDDQSLCAP